MLSSFWYKCIFIFATSWGQPLWFILMNHQLCYIQQTKLLSYWWILFICFIHIEKQWIISVNRGMGYLRSSLVKLILNTSDLVVGHLCCFSIEILTLLLSVFVFIFKLQLFYCHWKFSKIETSKYSN